MLSYARVAGVPLGEFCRQLALPYEENALEKIAEETRAAGLEIISSKGATYFGIAAALSRIVRAILRDENAVLTVSSLVPKFMELGEVSLSLPSIINRSGVQGVLSIPLSAAERQALEASARILKEQVGALDGWISNIPGHKTLHFQI